MASVWTAALVRDAEQALIATFTTPTLGANVVMEYANAVALTETTILSDLVEATYDGYARGTVGSWVGPQTDLSGDIVVVPNAPITFSCSGATTLNTVYGIGILNPAGTTLLAAADFPTPISPVPGQVHSVNPKIAANGSVDNCLC